MRLLASFLAALAAVPLQTTPAAAAGAFGGSNASEASTFGEGIPFGAFAKGETNQAVIVPFLLVIGFALSLLLKRGGER